MTVPAISWGLNTGHQDWSQDVGDTLTFRPGQWERGQEVYHTR